MLQEEIDDREGFNTEARQTIDWLQETRAELHTLNPTMEMPELMERVEKLRVRIESVVRANILKPGRCFWNELQ